MIILCAFVCYSCGSGGGSAKSSANNYPASKDKIHWLKIEEAEGMVKAKPKKMLVDVYTSWCGPCKMLDRTTFADQKVIDHVAENYYAVKFNAESPDAVKFAGTEYANPGFDATKDPRRRNAVHQLTQKFAVRGYPTILVIDENLEVKDRHVGFKQPDQLLELLK